MPRHHDTLIAAQYFTAVAGTATMRHCLTRPSDVRARLDDIRSVVDHLDSFPNDLEIPLVEYAVDEGYERWAPAYDGPNPAVDAARSIIGSLLDGAPRGVALDAACGTGCQAEQLVERGYEVIGVDQSEPMLAVARAKVPAAQFRVGDLHALPLADASVDVVASTLALTHVADLRPVIAEMARVLRPGGHVLLSDMHPTMVTLGGAAIFPSGEDQMSFPFIRNLVHQAGTYVTAACAAGLTVADCREPAVTEEVIVTNPAYPVVPEAVRQTFEGIPFQIAWRFTKPAEP